MFEETKLVDSKYLEGRERLTVLLRQAADHIWSPGDSAPLSGADVDEVKFLTELLRTNLPPDFVSIVRSGVQHDQRAQKDFGERLIRSLSLNEKYGELLKPEQKHKDVDELYPSFHLKAGERDRVLKLSSDIRKIILSSTVFDEPHKRRLLNRIAAIEKEVLQSAGKLDTVLAGISDVGDTLKKFGGDLKPLSDRFNEIVRITRSRTNQYDQIPAPEELDLLPAPEETKLGD